MKKETIKDNDLDELQEKFMRNEIGPDEFIEGYNTWMKAYNEQHNEPSEREFI